MDKRKLGQLEVSSEGLGCMGMSEFYGKTLIQSEADKVIIKAFELGVNFFDTADIYGYGKNEILLGNAITNFNRDEVVIATKCGAIRDENDPTKRGLDNSPAYIMSCCDASLKRLNIDYIDLYYLHRITNEGRDIKESMRAMYELIKAGKIRGVGLSEANKDIVQQVHNTLNELSGGKYGLSAVQTEYSLLSRGPEQDGVFNTCAKHNIGFVAYSPLSRALLSGGVKTTDQFDKDDFRQTLPRFQKDKLRHNNEIVTNISKIADKLNITITQLAIGWVLAKRPFIVPIPGTNSIDHLKSNISATRIKLDDSTIKELDNIAKFDSVLGERY